MIQKKKLVSIVCIIAVVAIACAMVFSFDVSNNSNNVVPAGEANLESTAVGDNTGYATNGDGLEDGSVPSGYTGTGTPISNATELSDALRKNTGFSYYLTTNITWSPSVVQDDGGTFCGTIDGCGYSITITADATGGRMTDDHQFGFLTGYFKGVLKNTTINISKAKYARDRLRSRT